MTHATRQGVELLNGFKRANRFEKGLGVHLPEAYKKFWREWKLTQPAAVHYVPKESKWTRNEITKELVPVQDIQIPLIDTPESHQGIWGGEAVIKGFQKRHQTKRRVPHFWVPVLRRIVVYSQVLNEYISVVTTERTLEQIHESQGFDHYLLKNLACDLRSQLALKIKRKILKALLDGCPTYAAKPSQQQEILNEYQCYVKAYTPEEVDWYGYTYVEAIRKVQINLSEAEKVLPHKLEFRMKLLTQLKQAGITSSTNPTSELPLNQINNEHSDTEVEALTKKESASSSSSWLSKLKPFNKKRT